MKVTGCEHIGLTVADVERSAAFYEENLGFKRIARSSRSEPYVQRVVGHHPDVTLEIWMLEIPGSTVQLELLEYQGIEQREVDPANRNVGTAHFCVWVDDLEAIYERLKANGVDFVSEVQHSDSGRIKGGKVVYMLDPDGIRVELIELPRTRSTEAN